MLSEYFHNIVVYLQHHPHLAGLITYLIALTESLAIIGTLIPGSVTMTAIGVLIGSGVLPPVVTIAWAVAGAFTGDFISYWVGAYYNERLRNMWPFRRYPNLLVLGENFFRKHGGKSIVIGRFTGPVRSIVPLIAGLMHMSVVRFTLAAIPTAVLWAIIYMLPGILIGALSLELPPATATKFILVILAGIALSWLVFWLIHLSLKTISAFISKVVAKLWRYLEQHRSLNWITHLLNDPRHPDHHNQLILAIMALVCTALFIVIFAGILSHNVVVAFNQPMFELLRSLRNRVTDDVMIPATLLGDYHTLLISSLVILGWLLLKKNWRAAWHWASALVIGTALIELIKRIYFSARPSGFLNEDLSSSFPSGHLTLSISLLGFLSVLIARECRPAYRKVPYITAGFFVVMIGLSRIYLGAHWLSDIIGSIFLGLACLLFITLSYRRNPTTPLCSKKLSLVAVGSIFVVWMVYGVPHFRPSEDQYTPYWPTLTTDKQTWWQQERHQIPLYLLSRLGKPKQVLNVEWLSSLDTIRQTLLRTGWQEHQVNLKGTINQFSQKNQHHLPLLPTLYQNQTAALIMIKTDKSKRQLIFEIWQSNITLADSTQPLWLGSIYYYLPKVEMLKQKTNNKSKEIFNGATAILKPDLTNFEAKTVTVLPDEQPPIMTGLHWDGKLLLVADKGSIREINKSDYLQRIHFSSPY